MLVKWLVQPPNIRCPLRAHCLPTKRLTRERRSTLVTVKLHLDQNIPADRPTISDDITCAFASSDLWSTAYREAVDSLGEDIDIAILKSQSIEELLRNLEETGKEATQESLFLRGEKDLQSIHVPLERFKLALNLTSPPASLEPTASAVFGVVRSVTAVSLIHAYCKSQLSLY